MGSLPGDRKQFLNEGSSKEKAIQWVKNHLAPGGGVLTHHKHANASQEVTGYLIETLFDVGEIELAKDLARWEASVQRPDGAFAAPDGGPYTFDTAQVVRGFLAVIDVMPELEKNVRSACNYVEQHITSDGKVTTPSYDAWGDAGEDRFTLYTDLYVLPPLIDAGTKLSETRYTDAAFRALHYFKKQPDLVQFKPSFSTLSHIFGYMMEALVDLGEVELARKGLAQAAAIQKTNGAIPAYPGVEWVCSTGMAQLALAWYKLSEVELGDKAFTYLVGLQNPSGGFYGSYGSGGRYLPDAEISWAVKFFLDCFVEKEKRG